MSDLAITNSLPKIENLNVDRANQCDALSVTSQRSAISQYCHCRVAGTFRAISAKVMSERQVVRALKLVAFLSTISKQ
jgi:hypothetical protein